MDHQELIFLIKKTVRKKGGIWADFGSGDGAFTLALRDLAGENVEIFSIDQDNFRLNRQKQVFARKFTNTNIHFLHADFTNTLNLPLLDGIIMANSLHYVPEQSDFLKFVNKKYLQVGGKLVLVEYNTNTANPWVPFPVNFEKFMRLTQQAGFLSAMLLEKIPSLYWKEMYSAQALK